MVEIGCIFQVCRSAGAFFIFIIILLIEVAKQIAFIKIWEGARNVVWYLFWRILKKDFAFWGIQYLAFLFLFFYFFIFLFIYLF